MPLLAALTWLGVVGAGALVICLLAFRCADWNLLPRSVLPRLRWWRRFAPVLLGVAAAFALTCGVLLELVS
ncbi:hypothetical protein [Actinophytocola oryzae]|uniref:Uncharacterized protein n=1 Tax=Actinophytocola oryzae TaxID=502181 RepID=A0A4R7W0I1_9PSEU|nr:hypothetical protein [Actinophytocola oryzae]TDV56013.1 hypothetical protein CLV71_10274 [Actinophytocola oryzae]